MSDSTGIVLAATAISFTNKWFSTNEIDLAIPVAGGFVAVIFNGIEKLDHTAGVGLAYMMLVTVLLTKPNGGTTPANTLLKWIGTTPSTVPKG